MADDADRAQAMIQLYQDAAIERQQNQARQIATRGGLRCLSCGDDIPEARRNAVPGCVFCIECQTKFEKGQ